MYIKVNLNKLIETEKEFLKSIKEKKALFDKFSTMKYITSLQT